ELFADEPIHHLRLVIPLEEEIATFLHYLDEDLFRGSEALRLPGGDSPWSNSFRPYVWLGNDWRGLAWFSETDEPFRLKDRNNAIEVVRRGGEVGLVINMITRPTNLGSEP